MIIDRQMELHKQTRKAKRQTYGGVCFKRVKDSDWFGTFVRKIGLYVIIFKVIKLNHKVTPLNKYEENYYRLGLL